MKTERALVRRATPRVLDALHLCRHECRIAYELTIGGSIADIVIVRASDTRSWPEAPLSLVESVVLSSLRRLGTASADIIAKDVFMGAEPVERLLYGRLSSWMLVRNQAGEFRSIKKWVSRSEIIAVEAKLKRWRDALDQATAYRQYADRAFVLLPMESAKIAAEHKQAFIDAGVGLLSYVDGQVCRVFSAPKAKEHAWHREFALSRVR